MSWVDIVIIVIVAICALFGLKNGLFRSLKSFFGFFLSFIIALFLTRTVTIALLGIPSVQNLVFGTVLNSAGTWLGGLVTEGGVIYKILEPLTLNMPAYVDAGAVTYAQGMAIFISFEIACLAVLLGLFILIRIVFAIFFKIVDGLITAPSPGAISRLLGFVIGAAKGVLYVVALLMVTVLLTAIPALNSVGTEIDGSTLGGAITKQVETVTESFKKNDEQDSDIFGKLIDYAVEAGMDVTPEDTSGE